MAHDGLGADGFFLVFPAIVVCDHGEGGEGDFGFAGEFGFREVSHADDVEAELAVGFAFCAGGEGWAVHVDVGAAVVDAAVLFGADRVEERAEICADGVSEADVCNDAVAEERVVFAAAGAVEELVGEDDVAGLIGVAETSDGGDADDPADVEGAEGPEIGAVIEFGGEEPVAAAVAWEEADAAVGEGAGGDEVRGGAPWGIDGDVLTVREAVEVVEAAAADDGDGGRRGDCGHGGMGR